MADRAGSTPSEAAASTVERSGAGAATSAANRRAEAPSGGFDVARRLRPRSGETACGDDAVVAETAPRRLLLAIIDAAGQGPPAAALAASLRATVLRHAGEPLPHIMGALHAAAQGSRGAAAGLAAIDRRTRELRYVGVGHTVALRLGRSPWRAIAFDGALGQRLPALSEQVVQLEPGDVVLLHTDGLGDVGGQVLSPRLLLDGSAAIAQRLMQQFGKPYDDVGCVVASCR